jgi:hypothetical protein
MILALVATAGLQPQTVVTVDPSHRLIEGIASDGRTIWLSSLVDRQLLACTSRCSVLATLPEGLHPFAIAFDSAKRRLWVAADCPPAVSFIKPCKAGAVLAYDLKGRIRARMAPAASPFHPGDVSVSAAGVVISDSQNGSVYRLPQGSGALLTLVPPGVGKSAQGSAFDTATKRVIVADYSQGISAIDLSGKRTLLLRENGKALRGVDGLARCGRGFVGVYNGQAPGQLVFFTVEGDRLKLRDLGPAAELADPTQLAIVGSRLLAVADSGWASIDKAALREVGAKMVAFSVADVCPE